MTKRTKTGLTVEYSGKDIMNKLSAMDNKMDEIHAQTLKTNGRVTVIEKKSIGVWIGNNPFKFAGIVLIAISVLISDLRQPLVEFFIKIFF